MASAEAVSAEGREDAVLRQFPATEEAVVYGLLLPELYQRPLEN